MCAQGLLRLEQSRCQHDAEALQVFGPKTAVGQFTDSWLAVPVRKKVIIFSTSSVLIQGGNATSFMALLWGPASFNVLRRIRAVGDGGCIRRSWAPSGQHSVHDGAGR